MKKIIKLLFFAITFNLIITSASAQTDSLLNILRDEMWIEFNELQEADYPPYFMEFAALDSYTYEISLISGSVISTNKNRSRFFAPKIRIGSHEFDNTHKFENGSQYFGDMGFNSRKLPLQNHQDAIRYSIWQETNNLYRTNLKSYLSKNEEKKSKNKKEIADFSKEKSEFYVEPPLIEEELYFDMELWKHKLKKYAEVFNETDEIFTSIINLNFQIKRKYVLNTENTEIVQNQSLCTINFVVLARNAEDEYLPYTFSFYAFTPKGLPNDDEILLKTREAKAIVKKLIEAPDAEPYSGPAILSAKAAGVFFHEILGHRIEGHRMEDFANSKTFKGKVGEEVLHKSISVYSDPTSKSFENKDLVGYYKFDDQGVAAKKVVNIKNGILNEFLMSRKPIENFNKSNGHGRGEIFRNPVARQSNLFIESNKPLDDKKLRKKLIKECKKQNKKYGLFIKTVSGGLTNTMVYSPDYFNIFPVEVYKIYTDGRSDELVKGVNLIGTPLTSFSEILEAGNEKDVFSGICGAESGSVPVSTVSPSILVRKIETQNQFSFKPEWPILPNPEKER
jgi:TldD protein